MSRRGLLAGLTLVAPALLTSGAAPHAAADPAGSCPEPATEDVILRHGEWSSAGTVVVPPEPGPHPAMVLVPGSGEGVPREWYRAWAEAFACAGIVSLVYDKRGADEGYSMYRADLGDLAEDAAAGVRLLAQRDDVDPDRIGLHGHSEGGWTVAVAAGLAPEADFVVTAAGSGLTPERTQVWMNTTQLRHAGVRDSLLAPLGEQLTRHVVAADAFRLAGHDPVPPLSELEVPVLGVFAELDRSVPSGESLTVFAEALDAGGNDRRSLRVVPGTDHLLAPSADGFDLSPADAEQRMGDVAPAYVETVADWVGTLGPGSVRSGADPAPAQPATSTQPAPLRSWESLPVQVAVLGVMLLAFASYPVTAAVTRLRGHRARDPGRWPARAVATLGGAVPVVAVGYLGFLMVTAALLPGPVVLGRPVVWLVVQAGGVLAVLAAVLLVWRVRLGGEDLSRRARVRYGVLAAGTVLLLVWGGYWGVFTP